MSKHRESFPSVTEIQLLGNISRIKSKAEASGLGGVVEIIDRFKPVDALSDRSMSTIDVVDHLTACITWAFNSTPPDFRRRVFDGYKKAQEYGPGMGYAPKAEVETFCGVTEPLILGLA